MDIKDFFSQDVIEAKSWNDCKAIFEELRQQWKTINQQHEWNASQLLFRGLSDSCLELTTTIDRYTSEQISIEEYCKAILTIRTEIETFTNKTWQEFSYDKIKSWFQKISRFIETSSMPGYDYMVYLRHHGFPSPLLDWTRGPFIAAFFAFRNCSEKTHHVAIHVYLSDPGQGKCHEGSDPQILNLGPNVTSHTRHFLQQSQYTMCIMLSGEQDTIYFAHHDDVLLKKIPGQDLHCKIIIPSSERLEALNDLYSLNINAFSLFGSEESLAETLALKEFYLR